MRPFAQRRPALGWAPVNARGNARPSFWASNLALRISIGNGGQCAPQGDAVDADKEGVLEVAQMHEGGEREFTPAFGLAQALQPPAVLVGVMTKQPGSRHAGHRRCPPLRSIHCDPSSLPSLTGYASNGPSKMITKRQP